MQITPPTNPQQPQDTPLHQILLNTTNLFWTLSAQPASKDQAPSPTGEVADMTLFFPLFTRQKDAFVFPRINCVNGDFSPTKFIESALGMPPEQAQTIADWILKDFYDWSNGFNTGRRKGAGYKEKAIRTAMLTLGRMSPEGQELGLVRNDQAVVRPQKEFYAFMENARYTEAIGSAFTGVQFPERIQERMLPMIEASALREIVQQNRAKNKAETPSASGFAGADDAEEAFVSRAPLRL